MTRWWWDRELNAAMRHGTLALVCIATIASAPAHAQQRAPIIDMHLHAYPANAYGPPPVFQCIGIMGYVPPMGATPQVPAGTSIAEAAASVPPPCPSPIWSPETDAAVMEQTLEILERRNIFGVLSGSLERMQTWGEAAPGRFLFSIPFNVGRAPIPVDSLRRLIEEGHVAVLGEVSNQYAGIAPDDERMASYWALAEELDVPVSYHMGEGPPYATLFTPTYRARLSSPYLLEEVLVRHPRLRISVMHYGSPLVDEMIAMLGTYPQIYVDVGGMQWYYPREHFYAQLRRLVDAGFAKRIMFGSDQTIWPGVMEPAIAVIEEAPFLSDEQKRDILYHNAARFLRLGDEEIARHHGR